MIELFPKYRNRMLLIGVCYIALVGVYIALNPGIHPLIPLVIALVGLAVVMVSQYLNAVNAHSALLARLYNQLDAEGFLREYEPLLQRRVRNQNIALSVRLHLSNAYCALGRFDDAMTLLQSASFRPGKSAEDNLLSRFAIVSNLCYCAEQKNDVETAQQYLTELLDLRRQLEALQESKPAKKRMVFSTELNEQCMLYLTGGQVDLEVLRALVQNNSQQLHKITISLWIARVYLAQNNRREAEKLLERIRGLAPGLYPGQEAARLLGSLPGAARES